MEHIRYIHGSGDSTDVDVHYVFAELPSFQECKKFCDTDKDIENRNIIVIKNGVVVDSYKGSPDEINNGLIDTYNLHHQDYPLLITRRLKRDNLIKYIRAIRGMLSHISRSQYRPEIKRALKSNWTTRLNVLDSIDLTTIDFSTLNNNMSDKDILKVFAFQLGQCLGLATYIELYTKESISKEWPILKPYLYRENVSTDNLNTLMHKFIHYLREYPYEDIDNNVYFYKDKKAYDLIKEKEVQYEQII